MRPTTGWCTTQITGNCTSRGKTILTLPLRRLVLHQLQVSLQLCSSNITKNSSFRPSWDSHTRNVFCIVFRGRDSRNRVSALKCFKVSTLTASENEIYLILVEELHQPRWKVLCSHLWVNHHLLQSSSLLLRVLEPILFLRGSKLCYEA